MKKEKGSLLDLMSVGLCILALYIVMMAVFTCADLIGKKAEIGQITRRYLLKMETMGYLAEADKNSMISELGQTGLKNISLNGTSFAPSGYGETIVICVSGNLTARLGIPARGSMEGGLGNVEIPVWEKRKSTAKQ